MFSIIKDKLYNNKLKKLYKDHINKYKLLLNNENKYKQENPKMTNRELANKFHVNKDTISKKGGLE